MSDTDIVVAENKGWITPFADWVSPRGLRELPDDLAYDDWIKLVGYLGTVYTASKWALGDAIRFGESRYGERYTQAVEVTKMSVGGLQNIVSVCEAFPDEASRGRDVPFSLYQDLASTARKDAGRAESLLEQAEAEKWTQEQLREELRPSVQAKAVEKRLTVDEFAARFEEWPERTAYRNNLNKGFAAFCEYLR